jgi:hypothetical protein
MLLFGLPIEIDDEAVAVVGESGARGNTERCAVDPPGPVLHNRPAAKAFPGSCGHDRPPVPPASSCRLRRTGKLPAGPYTTAASAPDTVSTPR